MVKKYFLPAVATIIIASAFLRPSAVHAVEPFDSINNLATIISQKFGLNQTQVQTVLTQFHQERFAQRQQKVQENQTERLDKLVSEGKITSAQKQVILEKMTAMRNRVNTDNWKNLTPEQRREESKKLKDDFLAYLKSQNIDSNLFRGGLRFGMMGHFRGR